MPTAHSHHRQHLRAIACALIGFACWVTADSFMKLAGASAVPKYELVAVGGGSGMATIFILTFLRRRMDLFRTPHRLRFAMMAFCSAAGFLLYMTAVPLMPLANFYVIVFLMPLLLAILSTLFLREPLSLKQWLAILAGFLGVLIAVNPAGLFDRPDLWRADTAVAAGTLFIAVNVLNMRILGPTASREALAFYPRIGPFVGGLLAMLIWGAEAMPTRILVYALILGSIGGVGWMLVAQAYRLAPVGTVAPFQYSQILYGAVYGYFIWGDVPTWHVLVGGAIIIASGIYILRHAHRSAERKFDLPEIEAAP